VLLFFAGTLAALLAQRQSRRQRAGARLEHHPDDNWSEYDISGGRWCYQPLHEHSPAWLEDDVCLVSYAYDDGTDLLRSHEDSNGLPRMVAYRNSAGEQLDFHYHFVNGTRRAVRDDGAQAHWLLDDDNNVARFTDFDDRQFCFVCRDGELCDVILPDGRNRPGRAHPPLALRPQRQPAATGERQRR
jgi:hypothetical protein